jgi:hypothetical protein
LYGELTARMRFGPTPYGVRSSRIGNGSLAFLGAKISVLSRTPSRIVIMTFVRT